MAKQDLQDLYAAIWDQQEGAAWSSRYRMTATEYEAILEQRRSEGYRLRSFCGYEGDGQDLAGFNWSSQHLSAPTAAPHQGPRPAFASRASRAAGR